MDFISNSLLILYIQKLSGVLPVSVFYAYACPTFCGITGERKSLRPPQQFYFV